MNKAQYGFHDEKIIMPEFYDQEEIIENCTVQILTNTKTGEQSIGWWRNDMPDV